MSQIISSFVFMIISIVYGLDRNFQGIRQMHTENALTILKMHVSELFNFADIYQCQVRGLYRYPAAEGMYYATSIANNRTFPIVTGWQLIRVWDLASNDEKEQYSLLLSSSIRLLDEQIQWKLVKRISDQQEETISVKSCSVHELPDWVTPFFTIKNPQTLISKLEQREREVTEIENNNREVWRANQQLEHNKKHVISLNKKLTLERDALFSDLEILRVDDTKKYGQIKELQAKLDHQECENEARLQKMRAEAQKITRNVDVIETESIGNGESSVPAAIDVQRLMEENEELKRKNDEQKVYISDLEMDKTMAMNQLETNKEAMMKSLNECYESRDKVNELRNEIGVLKSMNHSSYQQEKSVLTLTNGQRFNTSQVNIDSHEWNESFTQYIVIIIIVGGIGLFTMMICSFCIFYSCLNQRGKIQKLKRELVIVKSKNKKDTKTKGALFKLAPLKEWKSNKMTSQPKDNNDNCEGSGVIDTANDEINQLNI